MQKKLKRRLVYLIAIPISLVILLLVFLTVFEYSTVADIKESLSNVDKQESLAYGKVLFGTRGCASCHSIVPDEKSLGPNLFGIAYRQSEAYIKQSIVTPGAVIIKGFDNVVMPNFGDILDDQQVNALVDYISTIK
ncbi:hypothetical protein BFP97_04645 [Roseivirga sp. 4D4]|uniref:c-type cytochrome n=1 Tax=Roseivirga sp. 4D4 TaxID=1889784 RepID=UPI000853329A|nr:cytochrome c [Roseivirga sp. 4D4]OEK00840.1 hypothetical protein BFP97_04645 [Roseivirga sp. 4D4]